MTTQATAIFCTGPESGGVDDRTGCEFPEWYVFAGDDDGEPTGRSYTCRSFDGAVSLARNMARDRRLPLELDASPA